MEAQQQFQLTIIKAASVNADLYCDVNYFGGTPGQNSAPFGKEDPLQPQITLNWYLEATESLAKAELPVTITGNEGYPAFTKTFSGAFVIENYGKTLQLRPGGVQGISATCTKGPLGPILTLTCGPN